MLLGEWKLDFWGGGSYTVLGVLSSQQVVATDRPVHNAGAVSGQEPPGFTLIEIMIVIAIIGTLVSIAVPMMLRARHNANELAAMTSCKTLVNACQAFYAVRLPHTYPSQLTDLGPPTSDPSFVDTTLYGSVSPTRQGYQFTYTLIDLERFTLNATPTSVGHTGTRNFYTDETGVIHANPNGPATAADPAVE